MIESIYVYIQENQTFPSPMDGYKLEELEPEIIKVSLHGKFHKVEDNLISHIRQQYPGKYLITRIDDSTCIYGPYDDKDAQGRMGMPLITWNTNKIEDKFKEIAKMINTEE
jgi:hypothetical protein